MDSQLILKAGLLIKQSLKRILSFEYDSLKRRRSSFNSEELSNFGKLLGKKWYGFTLYVDYHRPLHLLLFTDDEQVKCFLLNDPHYLLADNYLIAMTCIYLIRAELPPAQYDAQHFFSAL